MTYTRTQFTHAEQLAFSDVKIFAGDGETLIRIISTEVLRARKPNRPDLAPVVIRPKHDPMPSVAALKTLVGTRRKREPV